MAPRWETSINHCLRRAGVSFLDDSRDRGAEHQWGGWSVELRQVGITLACLLKSLKLTPKPLWAGRVVNQII